MPLRSSCRGNIFKNIVHSGPRTLAPCPGHDLLKTEVFASILYYTLHMIVSFGI